MLSEDINIIYYTSKDETDPSSWRIVASKGLGYVLIENLITQQLLERWDAAPQTPRLRNINAFKRVLKCDRLYALYYMD